MTNKEYLENWLNENFEVVCVMGNDYSINSAIYKKGDFEQLQIPDFIKEQCFTTKPSFNCAAYGYIENYKLDITHILDFKKSTDISGALVAHFTATDNPNNVDAEYTIFLNEDINASDNWFRIIVNDIHTGKIYDSFTIYSITGLFYLMAGFGESCVNPDAIYIDAGAK